MKCTFCIFNAAFSYSLFNWEMIFEGCLPFFFALFCSFISSTHSSWIWRNTDSQHRVQDKHCLQIFYKLLFHIYFASFKAMSWRHFFCNVDFLLNYYIFGISDYYRKIFNIPIIAKYLYFVGSYNILKLPKIIMATVYVEMYLNYNSLGKTID